MMIILRWGSQLCKSIAYDIQFIMHSFHGCWTWSPTQLMVLLDKSRKGEDPAKQQLFELMGIVVHSGQASAGHYYSFIKEKQ